MRRPLAAWASLSTALRLTVAVHVLALIAWPLGIIAPGWLLGAVVLNHGVLLVGMRPGSRLLGPDMRRLPPASALRGEVALTFDDGPDPEVTPRVLDLLDAAGARASFFCIGAAARAHPALVREIVRRGHSVENHTETHPLAFATFGIARMRREIAAAQGSLAPLAGQAPRFFRAPAGIRSPLLTPAMAGLPLTYLSWTRRALDGTRGDAARGLARLSHDLVAGDILLMHDGRCALSPDGWPVVLEMLPRLLDRLAAEGLRAVSLPMALGEAPVASGAAARPDAGAARIASAGYASR
ncbi:polysaccharide deacetylase family protein [Acidisoma sp. S159]|jgi:peptidoglycan/xylan/chitin deacetylase (PgdA/CDA1 family)|uniref:polysaccharide deacetylase family protein n=3 Tax=unclassified Acidisoma TaxID=2634065 RepID=UPI00131D0599|nr:polysaccharide deacetylase family protein [Acidisoma sp. S159]